MHHIAPLLIYLSVSLVVALILGLITERLREFGIHRPGAATV